MKRMYLNKPKNTQFINYFISKERKFLLDLNAEAFYSKNFRFYIEWFIYSIYEYMATEYDIVERFTKMFTNNFSLEIVFFTYIIDENFRQLVINDIIEYKQKFGKEHIYA